LTPIGGKGMLGKGVKFSLDKSEFLDRIINFDENQYLKLKVGNIMLYSDLGARNKAPYNINSDPVNYLDFRT